MFRRNDLKYFSTMKIAFTSQGESWQSRMDARFGRTPFLAVYDEATGQMEFLDNRAAAGEAHGAGTATAQKLFDIRPEVLITGNGPGQTAAQALKHLNMRIFVDAGDLSLEEAYQEFKHARLKEI